MIYKKIKTTKFYIKILKQDLKLINFVKIGHFIKMNNFSEKNLNLVFSAPNDAEFAHQVIDLRRPEKIATDGLFGRQRFHHVPLHAAPYRHVVPGVQKEYFRRFGDMFFRRNYYFILFSLFCK